MPALLSPANTDHHKVVIVGAGAAGIATASSLISRDPSLDVTLIDPAEVHYYQPGWTMVGAGVFNAPSTARTMASTIPRGVRWIKARVQGSTRWANWSSSKAAAPSVMNSWWSAPASNWIGRPLMASARPWAATASPPTTATTWRPTPGNWYRSSSKAEPCFASRPCRSSAQARRRRRCTCLATTGCGMVTWGL